MSSEQLDGTGLKRLHREWRRRTSGRISLLLDNVTAAYNVGSIVRTAAALRVEHLWLVGETVEPSHAKVRRTSLGCERYLAWRTCDTFGEAAAEARGEGFTIVGLELAGNATALHETDLDVPVCLAVGHEDRGLAPASLRACDAVAFIPLLGRVGSLNVATATAIALYELRRREWQNSEAPPDVAP